jgi:hypothetical protein
VLGTALPLLLYSEKFIQTRGGRRPGHGRRPGQGRRGRRSARRRHVTREGTAAPAQSAARQITPSPSTRKVPRMVAMRSGTARCMRRDRCRSSATRKYALLNVTGVGSSDARDGAHLMREAIRGPHQRST